MHHDPTSTADIAQEAGADPPATAQLPGSGPDVDVAVADRPQLHGAPTDAHEPGLTLLEPSGHRGIAGPTYREVEPQASAWLEDVLADLLPSTARLVQDLAAERADGPVVGDPERSRYEVPRFVHEVLVADVAGLERGAADAAVIEEARAYLEAIGRYALLWADETYRARRGFDGDTQFARVQQTLERTGTSRGPFNAGVDALAHSLVPLHAARDAPLPLTFVLDGEAWQDADAATVRRALTVFDVLADGFDVRVWVSPAVRDRLRRLVRRARTSEAKTPGWADRLSRLTESGDRSRPRDGRSADEDLAAEAWAVVDDHASQTGLLTVLAHLDTEGERSVQALKRDDAIDYAAGSIDRYVSALEAAGLVDIDRTPPSNRLTLTPLGVAAQEFVTATGRVVHPDQSQLLGASYRDPSAEHKCSVAPQATGGAPQPPAERWLADTGDPREDGFVQFLGDAAGPRAVEPPVLHRRILAGERVEGVTFADAAHLDWTDDEQAPTGDGRVTYASIFDDHALLVTQWGGPAQTLGRLCAGLLGNRMLSKALDIDAVGAQFDQLHADTTFATDLEDVLLRAQQIGWLGEDERNDYDCWRERIGTVRSTLLAKLGELDDLDGDQRQALFGDLHGLLCSATHLYYAAGIDVTFNLRVPRVAELQANEDALQDFCEFLRFTVTKQAGYADGNGIHSIYRLLVEDRPQKLRSRASYDIDTTAPTADLTASWLLSGPGVSALQDDVEAAIAAETDRLRERVADGAEDAPLLEIPTAVANTHGHIRGLVRDLAERKDFPETHRQDCARLARCFEAALGTADRGPDPFLVADALAALEARDAVYDRLDTQTVQHALATLPHEALFPTLPPAARRMLGALFASDEPLDRQALVDVTSTSSYRRHHETLRAFFLVEETDAGFVAHLEPWWATGTDARTPYHEPHPNPQPQPPGNQLQQPAPPTQPGRLVVEVAAETPFVDIPPDRYYEVGLRTDDTEWLLRELGLQRWQPILEAYCATDAEPASYANPSGVCLGPRSAETAGFDQQSVTAFAGQS